MHHDRSIPGYTTTLHFSGRGFSAIVRTLARPEFSALLAAAMAAAWLAPAVAAETRTRATKKKPASETAGEASPAASKKKVGADEEEMKPRDRDDQESPFGILSAKVVDEDKLPIPAEADQQQADKRVRDVFKSEFTKAKTPVKKVALARQLLAGISNSDNDPAGNFAMLAAARDLAVSAGEVELALDAIDQLTERYRVPALEMKLEFLEKMSKGATVPAALNAAVAEEALELIAVALVEDNYKAGRGLYELALATSRKARNTDTAKEVAARGEELDEAESRFERVRAAFETLKSNPKDRAANLTAGCYLCLQKADWDRGLPLLARGNDEALRTVAQKELARPSGEAEYVALGDAWWEVAEQQAAVARMHARMRASEWYLVVVQELSGLTRARIEKRLAAASSTTGDSEDEGVVFLSDLEPLNIQVEKNWFNRRGKTPFNDTIRLNAKEAPHGIFMHPRANGFASVSFDLGKRRFKMFEAGVGLQDGTEAPATPQTFEVWGNSKPLWKSGPISKPGKMSPCKVRLGRLTRLELRVLCPGDSARAFAVWFEPRLTP